MTQPTPSSSCVVGLGETLWDVFPDGAVWGGAPGNVACHAAGLGAESFMVSGVGCDERGIAALESHGVNCRHVLRDPRNPTGTVTVSLGAAGDASYVFASATAWDHLAWEPSLGDLAARADAVCFGTLGQRAEESRRTIRRFLEAAGQAVRVFDVNLRQAFYSPELIRESLTLANVLKLNDDELPVVAEACGVSADDPVAAVRELAEQHGLLLAALTRGAAGSMLVVDGVVSTRPADARTIVDTVGAGDAFTAAVVMGLLGGRPLEPMHDHAARLAAFVCGHRGATPRIPAELRA